MGHYTVRTGKHNVGVLLGGLKNNKKKVLYSVQQVLTLQLLPQ